ncbi:hypothetical protein quinque_013272 [Culex quinquefasciatus]
MSSSENESSVDEQSEIEEDPSDLEEEQEQSNDESGQEASSDENADSDEETGDESKPRLADKDYRQMPFEDLLQLKRRIGSKLYNEAVFGKTKGKQPEESKDKKQKKRKQEPRPDSDSDGPPEEVSAKRKVPALGMQRKVKNGADEQRPRDPRFDSKQGYFSGRKFRSEYGFINELRGTELESLKMQLEKTQDPAEEKRLKFAIQRTSNQIREFEKQKGLDQKRMQEKHEARKALDEGKRPFYEKKKNVKKARELIEKYDQLKETGKLGKHIDKRRRKITAKDRKKLDFET